MKNLSKILVVVFLCATLLASLVTFVACDTSWDGLHCELSDDGTYYIVTGVQAFSNIIKEYTIGDTYKGLPVKAIGDGAFLNYWSSMRKITLPKTLERIGRYAFSGCENLTSVVIPDGVKYIDEYAFDCCTNLQQVTIPSSVIFMGDGVFHDCPNLSYNTIDGGLFLGNDNNKQFMVAGWTSDQIESLTIPQDTKFVDSYAFDDYKNLTEVSLPSGLLGVGGWAFEGCEKLVSVTLPQGATHVGSFAFLNCGELASVTLPNSVTTLGGAVFENCVKLQNVVMSDGLTRADMGVFKNCPSLQYNVYDNGLYLGSEENEYAVLVYTVQGYVDNFVIHPDTKVILDYAMQTCKMKNVVVPSGVRFMGEGAFHYCDALVSITFEDNSQLVEILPSTFSYCTKLPAIQLPSGITKVGGAVFSNCDSLTRVVIPQGVTQLGNNAFASCKNLKGVDLPSTLQKLGEGIFDNCPNFATINFNGTKEQWKNLDKDNWDKNSYGEYLSNYKVECADGTV